MEFQLMASPDRGGRRAETLGMKNDTIK